jgi:hypothetical protein
MEYLMTYGWAILIIAIVLGALFSLGVFSGSSFVGTTCIAASGYECTSPLLHAGTFTATLGQSTGITWTSATFAFVTGGGTPSNTVPAATGAILTVSGGLTSGATASFSVVNSITSADTPVALPSTIGASTSGAIWAWYTTTSGGPELVSQIATVTLKAV